MNRIDRLAAILTHLQSKKIVKAEEIAQRFGISLRTVYRDMKALEEAGTPIAAEAGVGYSLSDGYHLPPVMFTKEEASALLVAGKLIEKFTDTSFSHRFDDALFKIKSVLRTTDKEYVESLNNQVYVFKYRPLVDDDTETLFFCDLQKALCERLFVDLEYISDSKQELTQRRVESMALVYYGSSWHLIAYCRLRRAYRDFRLDRIQAVSVSTEHFELREKQPFVTYMKKIGELNQLNPLVVRFDNSIKKTIDAQKYHYGFVNETLTDDYTEITFANPSETYIAKWLLSFGAHFKIISPLSLQKSVNQLITELSQYHLNNLQTY